MLVDGAAKAGSEAGVSETQRDGVAKEGQAERTKGAKGDGITREEERKELVAVRLCSLLHGIVYFSHRV